MADDEGQIEDGGNADDSLAQNEAWLRTERAAKVPEVIARQILHDVVSQPMQPGDMLPSEATMLRRFGVGRASLREGLRILEMHGLIRIKPGPRGGPVVTNVTSADYGRTTSLFLHRSAATYRELLEARRAIEPMMARLAAERLTDETAAEIRAALAHGRDAATADADTWSDASIRFHLAVNAASGNHVLDLYACALVIIQRHHIGPAFGAGNRQPTIHVHDRIADAILSGDSELAEELTRLHLKKLSEVLETDYRKQLSDVVEWK